MRNQNCDSTELFIDQKRTPSRQSRLDDLMVHTSNKNHTEVKRKDLSKYQVDVISSILQPLEVQKMKLFQCIGRLDRIITITEKQKIDLISKLKHVEDAQQKILSKVLENKTQTQAGQDDNLLKSFSKIKINETTKNEACIPLKPATNSLSTPANKDRPRTDVTKQSTNNDPKIKISKLFFESHCNERKPIKGQNLRSVPISSTLNHSSNECDQKFEKRTLNVLQVRNKSLEKEAGIDKRIHTDVRHKFRKQSYPNDDLLQKILMKFHSVKQCIDKYKNQQRCDALDERISYQDHHKIGSKETFINNWILTNHGISSLTYNTNGMSKTLPKASNSLEESLNDIQNLSYTESDEMKSTYVKDSYINELQTANHTFDNSTSYRLKIQEKTKNEN